MVSWFSFATFFRKESSHVTARHLLLIALRAPLLYQSLIVSLFLSHCSLYFFSLFNPGVHPKVTAVCMQVLCRFCENLSSQIQSNLWNQQPASLLHAASHCVTDPCRIGKMSKPSRCWMEESAYNGFAAGQSRRVHLHTTGRRGALEILITSRNLACAHVFTKKTLASYSSSDMLIFTKKPNIIRRWRRAHIYKKILASYASDDMLRTN